MGFKKDGNLFLYNIHKGKGNYYEAKGIARGLYRGDWVNTFTGIVRFAGCTDKLDGLSDGARIKVTRCDVERYVEGEPGNYRDYTHFLIFDFDVIQKSKKDIPS